MLGGKKLDSTLRNRLVHSKETLYFALTIIVSITAYIFLLFSFIGIAIIAAIILFSYFFHALSMASIRRNGIRISEKQFPDLYQKAQGLASDMELVKMPSIYVLESSGFLNAFATRFFGKNMVVVYSEIFDLSEEGKEDQLLFVLAHEFAHLKRRHVLVHFLLLPAMFIPFLGEAYLRGCEYTCDRYAAFYVNHFEASKQALTMLAIGKKLAPKVNQEAFIDQINEESGFFAWLSEKLSSHPDLPKRLNALDYWVDPEHHHLRKEKRSRVVMGVFGMLVIGIMIPAGIVYAIYKTDVIESIGELVNEEYVETENTLFAAAEDNDVALLQDLIDNGEDMLITDDMGSTALHYAVDMSSYDTASYLIEKNIDIDAQDDYGSTALMYAVYNDDIDMVKFLLEKGADPTIKDDNSETVADSAAYNDNQEIQDLLEN